MPVLWGYSQDVGRVVFRLESQEEKIHSLPFPASQGRPHCLQCTRLIDVVGAATGEPLLVTPSRAGSYADLSAK